MRPVPTELLSGPFTRARASELGITSRMLQGRRFVRLFPGVWGHADAELSHVDWIRAAELALPDHARTTGITRLQRAGLDYGPRWPLRFVVEGDLHLSFDGVFLHRTKKLPPVDADGVAPTAAFVAYCATARVIDAIKVGDWLLHQQLTSLEQIQEFALSCLWRPGSHEAVWMLDHLDARSRSLTESETRAVLDFSGLPRPDVNVTLPVDDDVVIISDLAYRRWRTVVEYEGAHHQEDRSQYVRDIDRYAIYRSKDISYIQVTKEKLVHARTLVGEVHRQLVARGYRGEPPEFGERWKTLFGSCVQAVGPRKGHTARAGASSPTPPRRQAVS